MPLDRRCARSACALLSCLSILFIPEVRAAHAAPVAGFTEHWSGTSITSWGGGSAKTNPGTGGVGGAADGYLRVSTSFAGSRLGTHSFGPEYAGDWVAAAIGGVSFWLNDVGVNQALELHFSIGNGANFWQYNIPMFPPENAWQVFSVDLTSDANWTRLFGSGTFLDALQNVDRIHLRHDLAPYAHSPNTLAADFGIDQLTLESGNTPSRPTTWGKFKALYR